MPFSPGRAGSRVRTPTLIRAYLLALEPFHQVTEGEGDAATTRDLTGAERDQRRTRGDYLARIHQHVKVHIRRTAPDYQWPRGHSFRSLLRNLRELRLVELTGERERGALDPALGFEERTYIRVAEPWVAPPWLDAHAAVHGLWADPMGYLSRRYASLRPTGAVAPTTLPSLRPRTRKPAATRQLPKRAGEKGAGPTVDLAAFEDRRAKLQQAAAILARSGKDPGDFLALMSQTRALLTTVAQISKKEPWPDAALALDALGGCVAQLQDVRTLGRDRVRWLSSCQAAAGQLSVALASRIAQAEAVDLGIDQEEEGLGPAIPTISPVERRRKAAAEKRPRAKVEKEKPEPQEPAEPQESKPRKTPRRPAAPTERSLFDRIEERISGADTLLLLMAEQDPPEDPQIVVSSALDAQRAIMGTIRFIESELAAAPGDPGKTRVEQRLQLLRESLPAFNTMVELATRRVSSGQRGVAGYGPVRTAVRLARRCCETLQEEVVTPPPAATPLVATEGSAEVVDVAAAPRPPSAQTEEPREGAAGRTEMLRRVAEHVQYLREEVAKVPPRRDMAAIRLNAIGVLLDAIEENVTESVDALENFPNRAEALTEQFEWLDTLKDDQLQVAIDAAEAETEDTSDEDLLQDVNAFIDELEMVGNLPALKKRRG